MNRAARLRRGQGTLFPPPVQAEAIVDDVRQALVEVLADLLLEATGQRNGCGEEVGDEPEDHS
jgi:hypothetical protein